MNEGNRTESKPLGNELDLVRTITDVIRQMIVVLAPDGTALYANRVALGRMGATAADMNEESFWTRVVHPDDVDHFREERELGLLEGLPFDLEYALAAKTGNITGSSSSTTP